METRAQQVPCNLFQKRLSKPQQTISEATMRITAPDTDHRPTPQRRPDNAASRRYGVRLEGAPWLSLRDRCGREPQHPKGSPRPLATRSSWRSLSRLEVAVGLVLLALLSAVFRQGQHEPALALAPPDAAGESSPMVAPVSLVEIQ